MYNILICDDEKDIVSALQIYLSSEDYNIFTANNGADMLDLVRKQDIHLVLLDIMMPVMDGMTALRMLREEHNIPVIFLTAKSQDTDKVFGLDLGADDYIVKPFDILVLLARVENILRRTKKNSTVFTIKDCKIDLNSRTVTRNGEEVILTLQEFNLLEVLVINRNFALSREKLLQLAWGFDYMGDTRTVDVHIQKLRKKLDMQKEIATVYKYGYRLEV